MIQEQFTDIIQLIKQSKSKLQSTVAIRCYQSIGNSFN